MRLIVTNLGQKGIWYNNQKTINDSIKGLIICRYTDFILTNESEAIWEKKPKGRIVYFNGYFMFSGYEFREKRILLEWTLVEQLTRITQLNLWT